MLVKVVELIKNEKHYDFRKNIYELNGNGFFRK